MDEMKKRDYYISYNQENESAKGHAAWVVERLEEYGLTAHFWEKDRQGQTGEASTEWRREALENSGSLIAIVSSDYAQSVDFSDWEIGRKKHNQDASYKTLPFKIDSVRIDHFFINDLEPLDLSDPSEEKRREALLNAVGLVSLEGGPCRVVVVGDSQVGKTSVARRFTGKPLDEKPPPATPRPVDGVIVEKSRCEAVYKAYKEDAKVSLRVRMELQFVDFLVPIWAYRHRLFPAQDTVYAVVADALTDVQRQAEKWLKQLNEYAPECPFIILLNKSDMPESRDKHKREEQEMNKYGGVEDELLRNSFSVAAYYQNETNRTELDSAWDTMSLTLCGKAYKFRKETFGDRKTRMERAFSDYCAEEKIGNAELPEELRDSEGLFQGIERLTNLCKPLEAEPGQSGKSNGADAETTRHDGYFTFDEAMRCLERPGNQKGVDDYGYGETAVKFILYFMRKHRLIYRFRSAAGIEYVMPDKVSGAELPDKEFTAKDADTLRFRCTVENPKRWRHVLCRMADRGVGTLDKRLTNQYAALFCQESGDCRAYVQLKESKAEARIDVSGTREKRWEYLSEVLTAFQNSLNAVPVSDRRVYYQSPEGKEAWEPYDDLLNNLDGENADFSVSADKLTYYAAVLQRENDPVIAQRIAQRRGEEADRNREKLKQAAEEEKARKKREFKAKVGEALSLISLFSMLLFFLLPILSCVLFLCAKFPVTRPAVMPFIEWIRLLFMRFLRLTG